MSQDSLGHYHRVKEIFSELIASLRVAATWPGRSVDHSAVIANLAEGGGWSVRYGIMTALSCAIAILGLLLSSPAVIIGAMLISPLMTPIILFGFSLATLDRHFVFRSFTAIALGTLLAIAQAALIVWLSPLQTITPEILARTHPNFFDLLVAVFSGIAGAYAVTQHRGETLVGVAIATALMPPLAVIGFGVATANWAIFSGAGGLFMTNLLAIGLTASLVAKVFGFGSSNSGHATVWQTITVVGVFAVLSVPLGLSLKQIAGESVETSMIRSTLQNYFARLGGHIYGIQVTFPNSRPVHVETLVLVQKVRSSATPELRQLLRSSLHIPVDLTLSQIPIRPRETLDQQAIEQLTRKLEAEPSMNSVFRPSPSVSENVSSLMKLSPLDVSDDSGQKHIVIRCNVHTGEQLAEFRARFSSLQNTYSNWTIGVELGFRALPSLTFSQGSAALDANNQALLENIIWLLDTSNIHLVDVTGYSDTAGRNPNTNRRMALSRARAVSDRLQHAGIMTTPRMRFPVARQAQIQRESGQAQFRRVDITRVMP
jgi:uncharacterized hydrophobic protein (TIGR00271 family)